MEKDFNILVHETEFIENNLDPSWKKFDIAEEKLVNSQIGALIIECYDYEENGKHKIIGSVLTHI